MVQFLLRVSPLCELPPGHSWTTKHTMSSGVCDRIGMFMQCNVFPMQWPSDTHPTTSCAATDDSDLASERLPTDSKPPHNRVISYPQWAHQVLLLARTLERQMMAVGYRADMHADAGHWVNQAASVEARTLGTAASQGIRPVGRALVLRTRAWLSGYTCVSAEKPCVQAAQKQKMPSGLCTHAWPRPARAPAPSQ